MSVKESGEKGEVILDPKIQKHVDGNSASGKVKICCSTNVSELPNAIHSGPRKTSHFTKKN